MDGEEIAKLLAENAAETKRHFDVVAESLRADLRLVAEGQSAQAERIERLEGTIAAEFSEVRSLIKLSYQRLEKRDDAIDKRVTRVERARAR